MRYANRPYHDSLSSSHSASYWQVSWQSCHLSVTEKSHIKPLSTSSHIASPLSSLHRRSMHPGLKLFEQVQAATEIMAQNVKKLSSGARDDLDSIIKEDEDSRNDCVCSRWQRITILPESLGGSHTFSSLPSFMLISVVIFLLYFGRCFFFSFITVR